VLAVKAVSMPVPALDGGGNSIGIGNAYEEI
jgi:hypothetical protein